MVDKYNDNQDDDQGGAGSQSGDMRFKDFLNPGALREDLLPPDQIKRLLSNHQRQHEERVKKQKNAREQYQAVKAGQLPLQTVREGKGSGMQSAYHPHPVLADKAQFSGVDKQINPQPSENIADTNEADRNELENQYRLQYAPQIQPKFNPKPQFNR